MAASITGTFTIIDRASGAMRRMEAQAKKTQAAIESVGKAADTNAAQSNKAAQATQNLDRAMKTQERTARQTAATSRTLGGDLGRTERATRSLTDSFIRLSQVLGGLGRVLMVLKFGAMLAAISALIQGIGVLVGGLTALIPALVSASGAIAAFPSVIGAAVQGMVGFKVAMGGVGEALKAGMSLQQNAARVAEDYADMQRAAADRIRGAERGLQLAQRSSRDAQEQLTLARRAARRELVDMRLAAEGAALAEQGAALSLREARETMARTMTAPGSTTLDIQRAQLMVREAEHAQRRARVEARRTQADNRRTQRAGVEGNPSVRGARRGVSDALYAQTEATKQLADAQREANRQLRRGTAEQDQFAEAMKNLSPAAQTFVRRVISQRDAFKELRFEAQEALFPQLTRGFNNVLTLMPQMRRMVVGAARAIGDEAEHLSERITRPGRGADLDTIGALNTRVLRRMLRGVSNLAEGFIDLMVAAEPFTDWITRTVLGWTRMWREQQKINRLTGVTEERLRRTRDVLERFGRIAKSAWGALRGIGRAARPLGERLWDAIDKAANRWDEWSNSVTGQRSMTDWFNKLYDPLSEAAGLVGDLAKAWARITVHPSFTRSLSELRNAVPSIEKLLIAGADLAPSFIEVLSELADLLANLSFSPIKTLLETLSLILGTINGLIERVPVLGTLLSGLLLIGGLRTALGLMSRLLGRWRNLFSMWRRAPVPPPLVPPIPGAPGAPGAPRSPGTIAGPAAAGAAAAGAAAAGAATAGATAGGGAAAARSSAAAAAYLRRRGLLTPEEAFRQTHPGGRYGGPTSQVGPRVSRGPNVGNVLRGLGRGTVVGGAALGAIEGGGALLRGEGGVAAAGKAAGTIASIGTLGVLDFSTPSSEEMDANAQRGVERYTKFLESLNPREAQDELRRFLRTGEARQITGSDAIDLGQGDERRKRIDEIKKALRPAGDALSDADRMLQGTNLRELMEMHAVGQTGGAAARRGTRGAIVSDFKKEFGQATDAGREELSRGVGGWIAELEKGDRSQRRLARGLRRAMRDEWKDMGRNIRIVNGEIFLGTRREWANIRDALGDRVEQTRQRVSRGFTEMQRAAVNSLISMGYTRSEARGYIRGMEQGGETGRIAEANIAAGTSGTTYNKGANRPGAKGMRIGGVGLQDTVPVAPGHIAAPGELIVNRHTERRIAQRYGVDLGREVAGETRPHSAPLGSEHAHALGGRVARYLARGGYVQGAQPPRGAAARGLASQLFGRGFSVTSGGEFRGTGTYHDRQAALDFGDSVNNLDRLWSVLFPRRSQFVELFGPQGLYKNGQQFSDAGLQATHMDHIHVAILEGLRGALGAGAGGGAAGGVAPQIAAIRTGVRGAAGAMGDAAMQAVANGLNARLTRAADGGGAFSGGSTRGGVMSFNEVARLAQSVGLPGITFAQIAKGESSLNPRAVGNDPGGTQGLGLWQITTGFNDDIIERFGGREAMFDPRTNALAAKAIFDRQGIGAWYGTRFMTGTNLHYTGNALGGRIRGGDGGSIGDYVWGGWHKRGGSFAVNRPTVFGVGEGGQESVQITPRGQQQPRGGGAGGPITVTISNVTYNAEGDLRDAIMREMELLAEDLELVGKED